jgi:myo-inositol-1(or 4)-monophosphatase
LHVFSHDSPRLQAFLDVTTRAGDMAAAFFRPGEKTRATITFKEGGSPVTEADLLVDRFLQDELSTLMPEAGWLSEETIDSPERLEKELVIVVDPIDGTRSFAKGDSHWAVSVGVVQNGRPILGIVHAPALCETYFAVAGGGATLNGEPARVSGAVAFGTEALKTGAPQPLGAALVEAGLNIALQPRIGSLAVRIARVAAGRLDLGFAGGSSRDWDIAAADLILHEAGGVLADLRGQVPLYNRADPRHGLLTAAPARIHAEVTVATRRAMGLETI